ncbi:MAG: energy-coupling factor ABC transporter ATP-binding protein [Muribaculaceae bacterium]|nr:energy-coupling factor ABC transporter ATP-binding protein [Muribaculaceae bacterium]
MNNIPDIEFRQVRYSYADGYEALRGISFAIGHGEKVALLGSNGAGKSTLLLHTNGLLLPSAGEVVACGMPVEEKTLREVRRRVGMVFQNPDDQLFMPTVEEDVAFGPLNMGLSAEETELRIAEAMRAVGAEGLRKRSPMQLSGGQKRAVALATVLSMRPGILVLDEPTANLDGRTRRTLMATIEGLRTTCVIATHDLDMARALCPRAIVVDEGRMVADGPTAEIMRRPDVLELLGY